MREVLAADHRPPRPRQLADVAAGVDGDRDRPGRLGQRSRATPAPTADPRRARRTATTRRTTAPRPGVPVVSTYGGCGTASTSRPAWSSGSQGPSADVGDVHLVADRARHRLPGQRHLRAAGDGGQAARAGRAGARRRRRRGRCGSRSGSPSRCVRRSSRSSLRRERPPAPSAAGASAPSRRGRRSGACRRRPARCRARPSPCPGRATGSAARPARSRRRPRRRSRPGRRRRSRADVRAGSPARPAARSAAPGTTRAG